MATRDAEQTTSSVLQPTYHPADSAGDRVEPGVLLHVRNASASSVDLTLVTPQVHDTDLAVDDRVNSIAAGAEPFVRVPRSVVYIADDGLVDLTWSATSSVDFAVLT